MLKAGEVAAGGRSSHRGATGLSRSSKTADTVSRVPRFPGDGGLSALPSVTLVP